VHVVESAQTPEPVPQSADVWAQQTDVPQSLVNEHVEIHTPFVHVPVLHIVPLQHAWPAPPHAPAVPHVPALHVYGLVQTLLVQHACPSPPHCCVGV
jgi:hypothetical protein